MKMTLVATLENDNGVMCDQTTIWYDLDQAHMIALETSYADWLASLPRTIGAPPIETKRKT